MREEKLKPVHPGEVLLEEFLKPMGLSQNRLALAVRVAGTTNRRDHSW
jgi:antitoxin HigA-1